MNKTVLDKMTCLERAEYFYRLKGDYQPIIALEITGFSRRQIQRYTAIWNGLSKPTRDRVKGTKYADNLSALYTLSNASKNKQKKLLDILFPATGEAEATSVADALTIVDQGRLPTHVEKKYQSLNRALNGLKEKQLDVLFEAHEAKIMAWLERREAG